MQHKAKIFFFLCYCVATQSAIIFKPADWFYNDMHAYLQRYENQRYQTNWHRKLKTGCSSIDLTQDCLQAVEEKYSDEIALFRCKANIHSFIAIVWPATKQYVDYSKIVQILQACGKVRYCKKVVLRNHGPLMLIKHAYAHESWLGGWENNFYGIRSIKENICFPSYQKNHEIDVYLVEFDNLDQAIRAKHRVRKLFNLTYNSIHITDTHAQAISLAKVLFHQNSIDFLNNCELIQMKKFEALMKNNKNWLSQMAKDETFCIVGKAAKAAYGISDCTCISFITKKINIQSPKGFICKNKFLKKSSALHEIAYDPQLYFRYNEMKYLQQ